MIECDVNIHKEQFERDGYTVFHNFIDQKDVHRMARRMHYLRQSNGYTVDGQCPGSMAVYSDPIHSEMQEKYRKQLEGTVGLELLPTYTYARWYNPKEVLKKHTDRPACEISMTVTLEYDTFDGNPWPIYAGGGEAFSLQPGSVMIYRGCDVPHWRDQFVGIFQTQAFIHYVDANGPYKKFKYDCRPSLGASLNAQDTKKFMKLTKKHG